MYSAVLSGRLRVQARQQRHVWRNRQSDLTVGLERPSRRRREFVVGLYVLVERVTVNHQLILTHFVGEARVATVTLGLRIRSQKTG